MGNIEKEHFYLVNPGSGKKRNDCPYSFHKDGRDIITYIIPPKGYELVDFEYKPYNSDNDFYDGEIIAQYEKMTLVRRIAKNPMPYLLSFLIIAGVLGVLAHHYFLNSQPTPPEQQPIAEGKTIPVDTITQEQVTDSCMMAELVLDEKEAVSDEKEAVSDKKEVPSDKKEAPADKKAEKSTPEPKPVQATQPTVVLTQEQFHQEFWDVIYSKDTRMNTYMSLYNKYKRSLRLSNKEFNYLYLTILKNTSAFNKWKAKLILIPDDELKSINTIDALKQRLEASN